MLKYYNKTSIGYSHLKARTCCQDFSASYHDEERTIITACDGHGGNVYIRSNLGSKFASQAIMTVFQNIDRSLFYKYSRNEIAEKLKLSVLCEWNALVEKHISKKPITKKEVEKLTEDEIFKLKTNPSRAYGTTLNGAMIYGNKLICINIGDGGVFTMKKGVVTDVFSEDDEETVAYLTYSICSEDAFNHMKVSFIDIGDIDGVIVCTDGIVNPYQNMGNFVQSFVKPITVKIYNEQYGLVNDFIDKIGTEIGIGDDVSFATILKSSINISAYKR